jgi:hypothetical protein
MGEKLSEKHPRQAPGLRFGARFWDAVEYEIEALDALDFELFLAADRLPFDPGPGVAASLGASLAALCRARFSN